GDCSRAEPRHDGDGDARRSTRRQRRISGRSHEKAALRERLQPYGRTDRVTESKRVFRPGWVIALAPAVLSVVAAFSLGSARGEDLPTPDFNFADKVGHFLAFGLVQLTHVRAVRFLREPSRHPAHI